MIKTNVDRTIELLEQKGKVDINAIASALGAKKDNIELILTFLEEMGMVELQYGVTKTIASLKKVIEEKKEAVEAAEEEDEEKEQEEAEKKKAKEEKKEKKPALPTAPKGLAPKPMKVMVPAYIKKLAIPRFNEKRFPDNDKMVARLTNMIINLLEKFYRLPPDKRAGAVIVMNDILKLAKQNSVYKRKDSLSMEFILCSLLISIGALIGEYEENRDFSMAKKIHSTYHLMRGIALKLDKPRLFHYEGLIKDVYDRVILDVYSKTMPPTPQVKK